MVETLTPIGTNDPFDIRPLPGGSRCGENLLTPHVCALPAEILPEDSVTIAQQVAREYVKRKRFPQLLSRPLCRWVGGHIEVENAPAVMSQHQKHVKHLEANGRHGQEIDGEQLREVIVQEGAPGLRRRLAAADHVFAHAGLRECDADLEQFPMDAGRPPSGVFAAHPADQVADFPGKRGSSRLAPPNPPCPEETEPPAVPGNDRLGLNDGQRRAPVAPNARQPGPRSKIPPRYASAGLLS